MTHITADPDRVPVSHAEHREHSRHQNVLASYVDDPEPKDVLDRLMDLIDRQAVAYGIYSRSIHEGAADAARDARRERWAERRDATEDALREALGMEKR